jgi:probable rRNA maturation factor
MSDTSVRRPSDPVLPLPSLIYPFPVAKMRRISIANRHPHLRLDRRAIVRALRTLDEHSPETGRSVQPGELSIVFLTDLALARLHADFLDDPSPTDVITFAGDPTLGAVGEICVSADAALRQVAPDLSSPSSAMRRGPVAKARRSLGEGDRAGRSLRALPAKLLAAFSTELTLYLVHGWLHLAGYDDLVPAKKRAMRRAEARAMKILTAANCVPKFSHQPSRA